MTDSQSTSDRRPLAFGIAFVTALYAVLYRFVPYDAQAFLLWPFGALALYSGARLRTWQAVLIIFAVMIVTDLIFNRTNIWGFSKATYLSFALFVLLGVALRPLLTRRWPIYAAGVGGASVVGYAVFFLLTNAAAWLGSALPEYEPHTFSTLMLAYGEGLEFLRHRPGEVFGNPLCVGLVFGAHALLARAYFPAERFGAEHVR
jgi:hypothetical protein